MHFLRANIENGEAIFDARVASIRVIIGTPTFTNHSLLVSEWSPLKTSYPTLPKAADKPAKKGYC